MEWEKMKEERRGRGGAEEKWDGPSLRLLSLAPQLQDHPGQLHISTTAGEMHAGEV